MKILILHASAGYGHQKIAEVLAEVFCQRRRPDTEIEIEDSLHFTGRFFRWFYPAFYFYCVKYLPKLWGWFYEVSDRQGVVSLGYPLRRLVNGFFGGGIVRKVKHEAPDVIINTHFFAAEVLAHAKRRGRIHSKLITVITDFFPHNVWTNEGTDLYWVMAEESAEDLRKRGIPEEKITVGGIPVSPAFQVKGRKNEILKQQGFEKSRRTLLLTSGSFGLGPTEKILRELEVFAKDIQCFVVCGKNRALQARLTKLQFEFPVKIFGFVDFMPDLMEASDLMIAKPGGSTASESLAMGIPLVVLNPIPGQEVRNARLLRRRNASFFLHRPDQIKPILQTVLKDPGFLQDKKREIARLAKPSAAQNLADHVLGHDSGFSSKLAS